MEDIILVGFGGHAKSVADCIERQGQYNIVGYTDHEPKESKYEYLGTDDVLPRYFEQGVCNVAVCIGYLGKGNIRERLYESLKAIGYNLPVIIDPSAIVSESTELGEGTFIGKGAIVNSEARIGKMTILNTGAVVEHECIVGDFSHIAVSAVLCGEVKIGRHCLIGANATVIQNIEVESFMKIKANSLITKNIEGGGTA